MGNHLDYLTKRNGSWIYYRRVPGEYAHLDHRRFVRISTKVKVANDRTGTKAGRVAAKLNATQEAYWRSLADGKAVDAKQAYADAVKLALAYADFWEERVVTEGIGAGTANKNISHISVKMNVGNAGRQLQLPMISSAAV